MAIITHFKKNLLKERLKSKISSLTTELVDSIIDNLVFANNDKYIDTLSSIQEGTLSLIKDVIIETFNEIDEQYKNSLDRKTNYNISKSNVSRTIITIFGEVSFTRTHYISKLDKSYYFYIDDLFELPKYDHYDPIIKSIAIDKTFSSNQSQSGKDVGELFTNIKALAGSLRDVNHIPRQTINNWIKTWNNPLIKFNEKETPETIYVMADEKFIGCQDLSKDIMAKSIIAFEDIAKVSYNRNRLVNKTVYTTYSTKAWEEFGVLLSQKYDLSKIKNICILADGGSWIKAGLTELKLESHINVSYFLCLFHYRQAINHITTNTNERKKLLQIFDNKSKKEFKSAVEDITEDNKKREEIITKKLNYILNNYNNIKRMKNSNIGSSMESHISHCIANTFSSRPKGYSSKYIKKYFQINDYKNNNYNIIDLYLKAYKYKEQITLNETELDFSIFDKKGSNVPILDYGLVNGTSCAVRKIINM